MKISSTITRKIISLFLVAIFTFGCQTTEAQQNNGATSGSTSSDPTTKKKIKIALLLDTSNSMDGLISQAKSQLWKLVNELAKAEHDGDKPDVEIALYEYGNDRLNMSEGYIRQVLAFTSDLDDVSERLFSLSTNGGSEYCGKVIDVSLNQLTWSKNENDLQIIFIAGNEEFTQGPVSYKESCSKAKEKDVFVNTIFCGAYQQGINTSWKDAADLTKGTYMNIDSDKSYTTIATPYDQLIIDLNIRLNNTYIGYGNKGRSKKQNQVLQDANSSSMGNDKAVERSIVKSKAVYNTKAEEWDAVSYYESSGEEALEEIAEEEEPQELKGKTKEEKAQYLEEKGKERAAVQKEIQVLEKKRAVYIAENQKQNDDDVLQGAMINTVRKQATSKNYKFK